MQVIAIPTSVKKLTIDENVYFFAVHDFNVLHNINKKKILVFFLFLF